MIAAGARPCSGAMLMLVFALAQGLFAAGIAAVFGMALGTAVTTGALASLAVFAKSAAMRSLPERIRGPRSSRAACEFAAALAVLAFGAPAYAARAAGLEPCRRSSQALAARPLIFQKVATRFSVRDCELGAPRRPAFRITPIYVINDRPRSSAVEPRSGSPSPACGRAR